METRSFLHLHDNAHYDECEEHEDGDVQGDLDADVPSPHLLRLFACQHHILLDLVILG